MVQQLTIGGGFNGTSGVVSVPSSFAGSSTVSGTINYLLQGYLDFIASGIGSAGGGFENNDITAGENYTVGSSTGVFEEFTNTDTLGTVTGGSVSGAYTVNPNATYVAVQAPGTETLTGAPGTTFALFGANSNVTYSVSNGVHSSIFAAGGTDSIALLDDGTVPLDDTVVAQGNDTLDLYGKGSVQATIEGGSSSFVQIDDSNATVDALGSTTVGWVDSNSGGSLYFINGSTDPAYIQAGVFGDGTTDSTHVTAFGGAGGGYFIGGQGGGSLPNLLVGGAPGSVTVSAGGVITQVSSDGSAGAVTLVGAVNGDILDAQGAAQNDFFAGSGNETLIATSTTGSNLFQLGLAYPGVGAPASDGVVSTQGSGDQSFFLGKSDGATLYGSTVSGAYNFYNFVSGPIAAGSDVTAGGGTFSIFNFAPNSFIFLENYNQTGPGTASVSASDIVQDPFNTNIAEIGLSDGTTIKLYGVQASSLGIGTETPSGGTGVVQYIYES